MWNVDKERQNPKIKKWKISQNKKEGQIEPNKLHMHRFFFFFFVAQSAKQGQALSDKETPDRCGKVPNAMASMFPTAQMLQLICNWLFKVTMRMTFFYTKK